MAYIVEERKSGTVIFDAASKLLQSRTIFIDDVILPYLATEIQSQLLLLDKESNEEITIFINSPGGEVYSGLSIIDTIKFIKSPVKTICTGLCASMAAVILLTGDIRMSFPNARIMLHQPSSGTYGTISDMELDIDEGRFLKSKLYEIIEEHTNMSIESIVERCDRDYWISAKEAKSLGIIDEIIPWSKPSKY